MGNYLFNPRVLVEMLEEASRHAAPDFGHHIMPLLPRRKRAWAYDFAQNRIPGTNSREERGYWRDIGTIEAFQAAQRDVLGPFPRFDLANAEWPIRPGAGRLPETPRHAKARTSLAGPVRHRPFDRLGIRAALPSPG